MEGAHHVSPARADPRALLATLSGAASAETLGEALASGRITQGAAARLVAGTGLSFTEARNRTVNGIAQARGRATG